MTLKDSHNWTLNLAGCENVEVHGLNVLNNLLIPNNDGINITARNTRISDCNIWAGDDAIAANRCENLAVANCILVSRSSAIRLSGGKYCTFLSVEDVEDQRLFVENDLSNARQTMAPTHSGFKTFFGNSFPEKAIRTKKP